MARRAGVKEGTQVEVQCAFCRGKGKDPFKLLSPLSACGVCGGKGKVMIEKPYATCTFCGGTGIHPCSRLTCTACMGEGVMHVEEPTETCPLCKGKEVGSGRNYCLRCNGAGVISKQTKAA